MKFEGTPFKMGLQFIVLCLVYAFQAPVGNAIPFMYFRSDLQCKIEGEWVDCVEQDVCDNGYEHQFVNTNGIQSISMDYNLICEKRLLEATIISLGFAGQLFAYFVAIVFEIPRNRKTFVIFAVIFIEGLLLFSLSFVTGYIYYVIFVNLAWNFGFSYLYSQIFAYASEMYTPAVKEKSVGYINIMWTGGGLVFAIFSQAYGSWIYQVAYFGGLTVWIFSMLFYALRTPQEHVDQLVNPLLLANATKPRKSDKLEAEEQQKNFIEDLVFKFKELKSNKKYLLNAVIFIMSWTIFQVSYSAPFIAFNSIGGNMKQNVLLSIVVDFLGSFVAYNLLNRFDPLRLLLNNVLIIGVLQTISVFIPADSFYLNMAIILATKLSTRVGFPTLLTLLTLIIPYSFNQIVFNLANIIAIVFVTVLPYYRYFMESMGLNIFCGVGIMTLAYLFMAMKFKVLDDENPDIKARRLSRDFKKRSSFAPMKRNSDAIIDNMLRRSSMLADKAAMMIIDKQSVAEERKYQNMMKAKELTPISEF